MDYNVTPRPALALFATVMEAKLQDNDHKGGWDKTPMWELMRRLHQEVAELEVALQADHREGTIEEAADVANFAMMIYDNALNRRDP